MRQEVAAAKQRRGAYCALSADNSTCQSINQQPSIKIWFQVASMLECFGEERAEERSTDQFLILNQSDYRFDYVKLLQFEVKAELVAKSIEYLLKGRYGFAAADVDFSKLGGSKISDFPDRPDRQGDLVVVKEHRLAIAGEPKVAFDPFDPHIDGISEGGEAVFRSIEQSAAMSGEEEEPVRLGVVDGHFCSSGGGRFFKP